MTIRTDNDRPTVQRGDDGAIYLRASALGKCTRALAAEIFGVLGAPASKALRTAAEEGHLHEGAVKSYIEKEYGYTLTDRQGLCRWQYDAGGYTFVVTGHYEGIWSLGDEDDPTELYMWENKSMSEGQFKLWKRSLEQGDETATWYHPTFSKHGAYAWQISHYMNCFPDLPVLYTVKNRNTGELLVSYLHEAPYTHGQIHERIVGIADLLNQGRQALDFKENCDPGADSWFCSYRDVLSCLEKPMELGGRELIEDPEIEAAIIDYEGAKRDASSARKRQNAAKTILQDRVKTGGVETLLGYWADIKPAPGLDYEALDAFLAEHGKTRDDFQKMSNRLTTGSPR